MQVAVRIDPMNGEPSIRDIFTLDLSEGAEKPMSTQLREQLTERLGDKKPRQAAVRFRGVVLPNEQMVPLLGAKSVILYQT